MSFDLSEAQLERTELLLGARFPESYRRSMLLHNGGERDVGGEAWELMPIRDDRSEWKSTRTEEDVLGWTDSFRMWRTWPKRAISIARNGVGDALLFLREQECIRPEVYVWRHETGALEKIASDFDDLRNA
jgi:cell wall assembly regulator SMI1